MLWFIDRKIEKLMQRSLLKKRDKIVAATIKKFHKQHPLTAEEQEQLHETLMTDTDRFIKIIDRSVLRAGFKRASIVFWITACVGTAIAFGLAAYPLTTSLVPLFVPLMVAFVGWAVSIATIPVGYVESLKGIVAATVAAFEKELIEKAEHQAEITKVPTTQELQKMLSDLQMQLNQITPKPVEPITPPLRTTEFTLPSLAAAGSGLWQKLPKEENHVQDITGPNQVPDHQKPTDLLQLL